MDQTDTHPDAAPPTKGRAIKRLGIAAFAFFLIKGLLWLIIPAMAGMGLLNSCQP